MASQEVMAEALAELEVHNISTAPKFGISLSSLREAADSQEACMQLYERMKEAVGEALHRRHLAKPILHHCSLYGSGLFSKILFPKTWYLHSPSAPLSFL